ncbi:MAG: hypothetical protein H6718_32140 [Polyangiaceae bacterium]|nr:hypothetical protein [Polyangiaceae bacterium]MCB9607988.1 hypothetical protein [Polyangiaceae bacterium]
MTPAPRSPKAETLAFRSLSIPRLHLRLRSSCLILALAVGATTLSGQALANPGPGLAIEIASASEDEVDAKLVRRLIAIEIADVDVPPDPANDPPLEVALFFRVVPAENAASVKMLSVELWERGELHGTRRVSTSEGKRLTARRIAQASAQLVLGLRKRRLAEARRLRRDAARAAAEAAKPKPHTLLARLTLDVPAQGAWISGGGWLGGIGLGPSLRLDSGPRIGAGLSLMAGGAPEIDGLRYFEFSVSPGYDFKLSQGLGLGLGVTLGAGVAQLQGAESVAGEAGQTTTWTGRAVVDFSVDTRLSDTLVLSFGPQVGVLLRPLNYRSASAPDVDSKLSGAWLGGQLSLRVDPPGGL